MSEVEPSAVQPNIAPMPIDPLEAISVLAVMYANTATVATAARVLFAASDMKEDFVRPDITATGEGAAFKDQANAGIDAMVGLGLLELTGKMQRRAKYHRATNKLPRITSSYNALYSGILKEETGLTHRYIQIHSLAALGGAYFADCGAEGPIAAVSRIANISPEHARNRALEGYARIIGYDDKVSREIEARVREHPLAQGSKRRREYRDSLKPNPGH